MRIDVLCKLSDFRMFMILSTCQSFIQPEFLRDETVYPERLSKDGTMYVEAEDKVTLKQIREIIFVRVSKVLGIIYNSKSGRTRLKWRSSGQDVGKLTGEGTIHSLTNLFATYILDASYVNTYSRSMPEGD